MINVERAKVELTRSMQLAADREEYQSAGDFQRILSILNDMEVMFEYNEIEFLQNAVHKITGDGEVMKLFNNLLGIKAGF